MSVEADCLVKCSRCEDGGWVCGLHRGRPWEGPHACGCGSAGVTCPVCNVVQGDRLPRMPKGFRADFIPAGQRR